MLPHFLQQHSENYEKWVEKVDDKNELRMKIIGLLGLGKRKAVKSKVSVCVLVAQSCPTLQPHGPMNCSPPGSSVLGIWLAFGSFWPRDPTQVFHIVGRFFTTEPPGGQPQRSQTQVWELTQKQVSCWIFPTWKEYASSLKLLAQEVLPRNSLAVLWSGLHTFTAKGLGSIPGWGTKITQAAWHGQKEVFKKSFSARLEAPTIRPGKPDDFPAASILFRYLQSSLFHCCSTFFYKGK